MFFMRSKQWVILFYIFFLHFHCFAQNQVVSDNSALIDDEAEKLKLIEQYGAGELKEKVKKEAEEKEQKIFEQKELLEQIVDKVRSAPEPAQKIFLQALKIENIPVNGPKFKEKIQNLLDTSSEEEKNELKTAFNIETTKSVDTKKIILNKFIPSSSVENTVSSAAQTCDPNLLKQNLSAGTVSLWVDNCLKPIRAIPSEKLEQQILTTNEEKPIGRYFRDHPKALKLMVKILQDKKAMVNASKVLENRQRFIVFLVINISLFVILWMYKNFIRSKKDPGMLIRFRNGIFLFLFMFGLRLSIFAYFFHQELGPLFRVIKDHYLA